MTVRRSSIAASQDRARQDIELSPISLRVCRV